MRLRNIKYAKTWIEEHPQYIVTDPIRWKGKWHERFGNQAPIHVEIGMGKGQFLTRLAQAHPEINYIGIEKYDSVIVRALEKQMNEPIANLLLVRADAIHIEEYFSETEIAGLYLNFSDPWPKTRQAKRRLTHANYLHRYQKVLADQSMISIKTDNFSLFSFSLMTMNESDFWQILNISLDWHKEANFDHFTTEFEDRFVALGQPIFYMQARVEKEKQ